MGKMLGVVAAVTLACAVSNPASRAAGAPAGQIEVLHQGPKPLPPTAAALQFTGLAADNSTVLFGPVSNDPRPRVQLKRVPVTVKILKVEYLDGSTLVGLFEGFVQVNPSKTTIVLDPPWVTYPPCQAAPPDDLAQFGADLEVLTARTVEVALPPQALPDLRRTKSGTGSFPLGAPLPSKVALDNVPPVGMQGTIKGLGYPGSCIAWSFGYGLGSYTAARNPDGTIRWGTRDTANQVSSAFLYGLVHAQDGKTCPMGSSNGYLPQLIAEGAPSVAQVPYAPDCCYLNGINVHQQFPKEDRFRIGSFARIPLYPQGTSAQQAAALLSLKQVLAAGMAVAFAGPVFENFSALPLDQGVFYPCPNCWCQPGTRCGHGMLLVGYDDGIGDPAMALGAFLVQNSFGTNWPPGPSPAPPGQFYLSYQGFLTSQLTAAVAYPLDRKKPAGKPLVPSAAGAPAAHITDAYQWQDVSQTPFPRP